MFNHVIIPAAGEGIRFGANIPKALINVYGKPIIQWQLEAIPKDKNICISIVVGFKGDDIVNFVNSLNFSNVRILQNLNYKKTSVVDSIKIAERYWGEKVVILDGDVVILNHHIEPFFHNELVAIRKNENKWADPVFVKLNKDGNVIDFNRNEGTHEWACICSTYSYVFKNEDKFIFNSLQRVLPYKSIIIDSPEIDTKNDLEKAELWMKNHFI